MQPGIKEGETVFASSLPYLFSKPKVGDIVVFTWLNRTLIKRIKKIKSNHCLLEGDNLSDSLKIGWINKKEIIGKVLFK